eukprot:GGOE01062142.1.p1 GENE.GGOE01062142.1~~GGOE01062142.1.p1  ORF type:complete len:629 (-),score=180.12 GGOE01062142.1:248-2134(-)
MRLSEPLGAVSAIVLLLSVLLAGVWWTPTPAPRTLRAPRGSGTVAITGVAGFLGQHVTAELLQQGYRVRGAVSNTTRSRFLHALFPSLELHEAHSSQPEAYEALFQGCDYVVHVADAELPPTSPARSTARDTAEAVLEAAQHSGTVKRVVLTSPMPERSLLDNVAVSSTTDLSLVFQSFAQHAAASFLHRNPTTHLQLVTLHPTLMLGTPLTNASLGPGLALLKSFLEGDHERGVESKCHAVVHVSDVARAHAVALQSPEAVGQELLLTSPEVHTTMELSLLLGGNYQDWPLPSMELTEPPTCRAFQPSPRLAEMGVTFGAVGARVPEMADRLTRLGLAKKPFGWKAPLLAVLAVALRRALWKALGGGIAGALAMVFQVFTLMWLRTTMNYQYRYGHTTREAIAILYREGGISRFYRGLLPALLQGPLSRFCDTAANTGVLALVAALPLGPTLSSFGISTMAASAAASGLRVALMPVDALKTIMQVEGQAGVSILLQKIADNGPGVLFAGSVANLVANFVGHYPWYLTYNWLSSTVPPGTTPLLAILRNACIGVISTINSDVSSNGLRVIKTAVQTNATPIGYWVVVRTIWQREGAAGFLRGLKTRMLTNILQGAMFSVMWRILMDSM